MTSSQAKLAINPHAVIAGGSRGVMGVHRGAADTHQEVKNIHQEVTDIHQDVLAIKGGHFRRRALCMSDLLFFTKEGVLTMVQTERRSQRE